jgi:hypothetical protein
MRKLYEIKIRHCSQKDFIEASKGYIVAQNDEEVYNYINKFLLHGIWSDRNNDSLNHNVNFLEDEGFISKESYKEKMLRYKGEFFDPNASYDDRYYGVTHYGWVEVLNVLDSDIDRLISLNIAKLI